MHNLQYFFDVGEKEIFGRLISFADSASRINDILLKMFSEKSPAEIERYYETVKDIEVQSDEVATQLYKKITSGAMSPVSLNALVSLVNMADNIIDLSFNIARELYRFSRTDYAKDKEAVEQMYKKMCEIAVINTESLNLLKMIFAEKKTENIEKYVHRVVVSEEIVDEIKDSIIDSLYRDNQNYGYLTFYHLQEVVHKMDDVLDTERDIAELINSLVLSML